ncbi:hypothetical protein AMATHDRAFT_68503 [Amanita thiersii Skay4041]|uniref:Uncharacterized protein n=1 Tax=Amanita thiersii Skay4041 TaxID=703135 RepID=A0A2A9NAD8_9AGAR|nr:hypothetical protein AMATHDRAFT_68503 [Amanita thiersii Skay4041]
MPDHSQYAAATNIPLIKSPSLRVPRQIEQPHDVHPLPDSVNAYFAYPFTLEPHVLTFESSRRSTLAAHATRREAYLRSREEDKERRKRDVLRKIAPGFDPQGVLMPMRATPSASTSSWKSGATVTDIEMNKQHGKSAMDDLVDQLAAMEAAAKLPSSSTKVT